MGRGMRMGENSLTSDMFVKVRESVRVLRRTCAPPELRRALPGTMWGLTTFFNPCRYKTKLRNYKAFRAASKRQGLRLCAVELAFDEAPFELTRGDADELIQVRGTHRHLLWQKERLLNLGLAALPKNCDKVAWLDADVLFESPGWVRETSELLERYPVVQPYAEVIKLPRGVSHPHDLRRGQASIAARTQRSRGWWYGALTGPAYFVLDLGHTGYAWAARRRLFDKVGFYDRLLSGRGDKFMANAFYGYWDIEYDLMVSAPLRRDLKRWFEPMAAKVRGSVYFTPGTLFHLWHGNPRDRQYRNQELLLKQFGFDPRRDLQLDTNGCWAWKSRNPELREQIGLHFSMRREDGRRHPARTSLPNR